MLIERLFPFMNIACMPVPRMIIPRMAQDELHKVCIFHATRKHGPCNHITELQYKSPTTETNHACDTRVVFVSHACYFCGVGGCLATHVCGYMCVHAQIVLNMHVPTCTQSVYTRVLFASVT